MLQVGFDYIVEIGEAAYATADGVAGDQAAEAFDLIDLEGRRRGEVRWKRG